MPNHEKLYDVIKNVVQKNQAVTKKVLVLGSGFVAGPLVDHLLSFPNFHVTIGNSKSF